MRIDDSLYTSFLEEMEALDAFRIAYRGRYPGAALDREDPDVRRLMEAMALFSARTRQAAERHKSSTYRRMFQQFFPWMLTPLPSMGVVQAVPTGMLAESAHYPLGTEVALAPESGGVALFETLAPLTILPVEVKEVKRLNREEGGVRICLCIETSFARNDAIGTLSFFINHLNDYETSLSLHCGIESHLQSASVVFEEKADAQSLGEACKVSFGLSPSGQKSVHPLERERRFFHFPWQDLFFHVEVPQPSRAWKRFTLCLDLDDTWRGGVNLSTELFHLFAVPVINLRSDRARPIQAEGTREYGMVHHPDAEKGFSVHSVKGIFEVTQEGMVPIDPGILFVSAPSWESESISTPQGGIAHRVNLNFPEAFEEPKTLSVTACWHQPWFSQCVNQRMEIRPWSRETVGVNWELASDTIAHEESPLEDNLDVFLRFLTLTNRVELSKTDLLDLFQALGMTAKSRFASVLGLLADVTLETSAHQQKGAGAVTSVYTLYFYEHGSELEPLIQVFMKHVGTILDAWVSAMRIEVRRGETDRPLESTSS